MWKARWLKTQCRPARSSTSATRCNKIITREKKPPPQQWVSLPRYGSHSSKIIKSGLPSIYRVEVKTESRSNRRRKSLLIDSMMLNSFWMIWTPVQLSRLPNSSTWRQRMRFWTSVRVSSLSQLTNQCFKSALSSFLAKSRKLYHKRQTSWRTSTSQHSEIR